MKSELKDLKTELNLLIKQRNDLDAKIKEKIELLNSLGYTYSDGNIVSMSNTIHVSSKDIELDKYKYVSVII